MPRTIITVHLYNTDPQMRAIADYIMAEFGYKSESVDQIIINDDDSVCVHVRNLDDKTFSWVYHE